jgi:hypothetical protein
MQKVTIAFDIDGTIRDNTYPDRVVANERIRSLLVTLASFKNTHIILWSGGGEIYARQIANSFGITKYIDGYADKQWRAVDGCVGGNGAGAQCVDDTHNHFGTELQPDIAIDDMQKFTLGKMNLIVREK